MQSQLSVVRTPAERQIVAPNGVSKSTAKAMECGHYYIHQYLNPLMRQMERVHPLTIDGTDFHLYRRDSVMHLCEVDKEQDVEWVEQYIENKLAHGALSETAAFLIRNDSRSFRVRPDTVLGVELFLSCTEDLQPLDCEPNNNTPGKMSAHPNAFASATLDLVLAEGPNATIVDAKSGFSTTNVTDDEPAINALVVFAHYEHIKNIKFVWDFIRSKTNRPTNYTRGDIPWMVNRVRKVEARKRELIAMARAGQPLPVTPCGLCVYCSLQCPLQPAIDNGLIDLAPIRTKEDQDLQTARYYVLTQYVPRLRKNLLDSQAILGPSRVNDDIVLKPVVSTNSSYPLVYALNALDLAVVDIHGVNEKEREKILAQQPESSTLFDVPLKSLTASAGPLNSFAKTAKSRRKVSRAGMSAVLDGIAKRYPKTRIRFVRESDTDTIRQLKESLAAIGEKEEESEDDAPAAD